MKEKLEYQDIFLQNYLLRKQKSERDVRNGIIL